MPDDTVLAAALMPTPARLTGARRLGGAASPVLSTMSRLSHRACVMLGLVCGGLGVSAGAHAGSGCQQATLDGDPASRMTVCISRQAFDNDIYTLRLDGKQALRATDDEVSRGVFANVAGRRVAMRCIADETPTRVSPAVAQALSWQTGVRVQRIADALSNAETGRRCAVKIDGEDVGVLSFAFN